MIPIGAAVPSQVDRAWTRYPSPAASAAVKRPSPHPRWTTSPPLNAGFLQDLPCPTGALRGAVGRKAPNDETGRLRFGLV